MSKKVKAVLALVLVVAVGLTSLGIYSMRGIRGRRADAQEVSVQETQAKRGTITNTIIGTGNLQYEEGSSITIPSGIVIDEVKVESSECVSKGDILAVVNQTSVLKAMADIQQVIEDLDEEIEESKDDTDSRSIKAKIAGKVKKIYVEEGQKVSDCMVSQGALMLLSLEDYVEVENEADAEIIVTATTGTVAEICVSEGQDVYAGTTLLKVESDEPGLEYQGQMAKRQELAERLQKLIALSESGVITAKSDGIIITVNISADSSASGTEDTQSAQRAAVITGKAEISKNVTAVVGSAQVPENPPEGIPETGNGEDNNLVFEITDSGTSDQNTLVIETPKTGEKPQTTLQAEDGSYEGTISWKPEGKKFAAETSYQASVFLTASEGFLFHDNSISRIKTGVLSGVTVTENGKKLSLHITYPYTAAQNGNGSGNGTGNNDEASAGKEINGAGNNSGSGNVIASASSSQGESTAASGTIQSQIDSSAENTDSVSEIVAFTMASSDTMVLSVNVDELDINSVSIGQEAEIALDAIENEIFTGTVTRVGNSASNSGNGVAKYVVELTVPGDERMKEGMNASAAITIEEREDVVTIPVNALQERGVDVFVYTQADSGGNLSGERQVTTGLSDGNTVEITEGLSEGETVYYQKTGNTSGQGGFDGAGGGRGNMDGMPGGGMPGGQK